MAVLMNKYYSYSINVETELKFSERVFPAVTTCHLNPWKASRVNNTDLEVLIEKYVKALTSQADDELSAWGFEGLNKSQVQQRAVRWAVMIGAELPHQTVGNKSVGINYTAAYEYDDLVMSCAYNTEPCNSTHFQEVYIPDYGLCYTFNMNAEGAYTSSRAGPLYGLRLVMRVEQDEYLPWTEGSGVVVAIHAQGEQPFADAFGYFAPPGTAASLGVRYVETRRQPQPYGPCTETQGAQQYYYDGTYLVEGCFRSCIQDKVVKSCGCYDPAYAAPNDTSVVSCASYDSIAAINAKIDCIDNLLYGVHDGTSNNTQALDVMGQCGDVCPQPCQESAYSVTVSTAVWPSDVYKPAECNGNGAEYWGSGDCVTWYKANTLLIEVYYERMNYQLLSESKAYSIVNLVSDTGGQLGLWLGVSVITVIEFFSLSILLLCYCGARVKADDLDDDDEDDSEEEGENEEESDSSEDAARPKTADSVIVLEGIYGHDAGDNIIPPPIRG